MQDTPSPRLDSRRPWQRHGATQLLALLLGVGPLYALSIYSGYAIHVSGDFVVPDVADLLAQLAVMLFFGLVILALLQVLGERPRDLQLQPGTLGGDIAQGLGLFVGLIAAMVVLNLLLGLFGVGTVPESNLRIGEALAADPLLLAVFLGPVVWLQAGLLEELTRVFALSRLWHVWPRARWLTLLLWSAVFGFAHLYQGVVGVVGTALIGLLLGAHYLRHGRLLPLIVAHALWDTLALVWLVTIARNPELLEELRQAPAALL